MSYSPKFPKFWQLIARSQVGSNIMTPDSAGIHSLIACSKTIALDNGAVVEESLVVLLDKSKHLGVPSLRIFLPSACYKTNLFMYERDLDSSPRVSSLGHRRSRISRVIKRNVEMGSSVREVMNRIIMSFVTLIMSHIFEDMTRKQRWLIVSCLDSVGRKSDDLNRIIAVGAQLEYILDARRSIIARERLTATNIYAASVSNGSSYFIDIADVEDKLEALSDVLDSNCALFMLVSLTD